MKLFFRFRKRRAMADRTTFKKRMSPGTRKTTFPPLAIGIDGTTVPSAPVPCCCCCCVCAVHSRAGQSRTWQRSAARISTPSMWVTFQPCLPAERSEGTKNNRHVSRALFRSLLLPANQSITAEKLARYQFNQHVGLDLQNSRRRQKFTKRLQFCSRGWAILTQGS